MMYIMALEIKIRINILNNIIVLKKYLDYNNIILSKFIIKLLKYINNNYTIEFK